MLLSAKMLTLSQVQSVLVKETVRVQPGQIYQQTAKLTGTIAKWIATVCRAVNIAEDQGPQGIIQTASDNPSYKPTLRGNSYHKMKVRQLAQTTFITGDVGHQ